MQRMSSECASPFQPSSGTTLNTFEKKSGIEVVSAVASQIVFAYIGVVLEGCDSPVPANREVASLLKYVDDSRDFGVAVPLQMLNASTVCYLPNLERKKKGLPVCLFIYLSACFFTNLYVAGS